MKNLFNLNESEKNRILSLHDNHKLKMYGLLKEDPNSAATPTNEYLNKPRLGDPFDYLKVGDEAPTYYFKVTSNPTGKYKQPIKDPAFQAKWDKYTTSYPNWTKATGNNYNTIQTKVEFSDTPSTTPILNPIANSNANTASTQTNTASTQTNTASTENLSMQPLKPNQVTSNKGIDPNAQIQRNLDLQTRKDGQINVKDAAKQIKQQDKNAEKLFQQMENDIVKSCLVPVKNIEKSYFGRGIFNRAMKPEQIDQLLKQDKIKQELITNLTELFKKIKVPVGATLLDTGKRCVDYDKVKQQIGKFPNFKPEELAKKVGLDINNLSEKPKNVTPPKAAADEYNKTKEVVGAKTAGGTSTGGSGMGAMAKSDADFDAMINQGNTNTKPTDVNLTNTAGAVNNNNQPNTNTGNEKMDYLRSQLNVANNPNTKPNTNEPDEEDYYSGTLGSKFK
jgi:hypothetical protein